ncbi:AMP-binding protein [Streptomyces sp. NPDC051546]|uniref:AMP-binding protein n=1 Tax=Streptomyces sp. NPDC051546 TaxID=3365655 RepID=UPI0037B644B5
MPRPDPAALARPHSPVHDVVAAVARKVPARTAVRTGTDAVTYRELDLWAGQIAGRLTAAGVGRGDRVGVLVEPSPALVAAALGALRAGAAYVPLDPATPAGDLGAALSGVAVRCVVTRGAGTGATRPGGPGAGRLPTVAVEPYAALPAPGPERECAASPVSGPDGPACVAVPLPRGPGAPGGVVVTHAELSAAMATRRALCPGTPVLLLAEPLAHEAAAAGLWATLAAGGRLILADAEQTRAPGALAGLVERHRVTQLLCTSALFEDLLGAAGRPGLRQQLRTLDTVTLAAGPPPASLLDRHEALLGRTVALVDLTRSPTTAPATGATGAAFDADARGRFGRPDAVVRCLARPTTRTRAGAVPAR